MKRQAKWELELCNEITTELTSIWCFEFTYTLFSKRTPLWHAFILHLLVRPIMEVSEWISTSSPFETNELFDDFTFMPLLTFKYVIRLRFWCLLLCHVTYGHRWFGLKGHHWKSSWAKIEWHGAKGRLFGTHLSLYSLFTSYGATCE